uniref:Photosystem I assembly protein Ycf3 n=1 Tax=Oryza brachyantha TaxID=4533 RepID=J3LVH6_ORYBR
RGEHAILQGDSEIAEVWFDQAAEYWKQAIALTPGNYIEAQNWLKITKHFDFE